MLPFFHAVNSVQLNKETFMLCLNKILSIWVVAVGGKTSFTLSLLALLSSTQSPTMISRTLLLLYGARKMNHGYVKRLQVDVNQLFFSFVPPFSRSRLELEEFCSQ